MKVQIRDGAALRQVSPAQLSAYLKATGWVHEENWREVISIWIKAKEEQTHQVMVSLREQSDVYAQRIAEAVITLSEVEGRSQLAVYYDLLAAGSDVLRLRPQDKPRAGGSLPVSAALLTQARDLVTAAARAAERPGWAVYRGPASAPVMDYVRQVRPVPGYETGEELTLHSPVPAEYGAAAEWASNPCPPFARQVTLSLYAALHAAREGLVSVLGGAPLAAFDPAAAKGASANFCAALAALARQGGGIGVRLAWGQARPAEKANGDFAFTAGAAEVLAQGAEWLRQNTPFPEAALTGEIVRLDPPAGEPCAGPAVALVLAELDGRPAAVPIPFAAADQKEVRRAFEQGLEIRVTGDIHREGRRYVLKNPRNFAVLAG